jgi:hypothetical protein
MRVRTSIKNSLVAVAIALVAVLVVPSMAAAAPLPQQDPFYAYSGSTPLQDIAPGTVLKTRSLPYHAVGVLLPLKTTQLLYRSTGQTGQPTVNVTSIVQPLIQLSKKKVVSYQSVYDSLNQNDEPSYSISGGLALGGMIPAVETTIFGPLLLSGYTIVISDTEGQKADFAAGQEYGINTLDSIRAAFKSPTVGLPSDAKVAMVGYSGGAIATEWASELAPTYAPDVNRRLVGAAMGGVLVSPAHNLRYVNGSSVWAGVIPMALIGVARAYNVDLTPYLSDYGSQIFNKLKDASIVNVLGQYPGLTWAQLAKPQYQTPESVPIYVELVNKLIMGTGGTPTIPLFIGQGANGELEGTPGTTPGIGRGDGVMIAGDVRSLAREYCSRGTKIQYTQYDALSHTTSLVPWVTEMLAWVNLRLAGVSAPQNCSQIAPGNSLAPIPVS